MAVSFRRRRRGCRAGSGGSGGGRRRRGFPASVLATAAITVAAVLGVIISSSSSSPTTTPPRSGFARAFSPAPGARLPTAPTPRAVHPGVLHRGGGCGTTTSSLHMIGGFNLGGGSSKSSSEPSLPRDVKDAVSKCRQSVQDALGRRLSRMDVEFPVGTKFGVEKDTSPNKKRKGGRLGGALADDDDDDGGDSGGATPTREQLDKSDRELARLFVDMFQPVGGENIAVCFADEGSAEEARRRWRDDPTAVCRVLGVDRKGKRGGGRAGGGGGKKGIGGGMGKKKGGGGARSRKKAGGFAAKMAAELEGGDESPSGPFSLPEKTEVALFVSPGPRELIAIERICSNVGMGTLVVLLNARLSRIEKYNTDRARALFTEEFEPVFHLGAAPQECAPGCLLHRAYPGRWIMARKPKVGPPKTITVTESRPTNEECGEAYDNAESGEAEKAAEGVLENVAGWFK